MKGRLNWLIMLAAFRATWSKVITPSYIGSTQCYFSSIGERVFAVSWLIGATGGGRIGRGGLSQGLLGDKAIK